MDDDWRANLVDGDDDLRTLLAATRSIAVLGMKAGEGEVSYRIPAYMRDAGYQILPVNPKLAGTELMGATVVATLTDLPTPVDLVDVFRASSNIPGHVDELLALHPAVVWMQLGIRHDPSAERLARAGIKVVQDRCLLVAHQRLF